MLRKSLNHYSRNLKASEPDQALSSTLAGSADILVCRHVSGTVTAGKMPALPAYAFA